MKIDEKIITRINELISLGERVLSTKKDPPPNIISDPWVDSELANQWATSSQGLLSRVFGIDSPYYENFKNETKHITFSPTKRAVGVLRAALDDYKHEYLFDLKKFIEAGVFDDFLEQSEYLLSNKYYQPAAVIAGCVLEDGLRNLCKSNKLDTSSKPKLDKMNSDLAKLGVYNKFVQKQITAYADLRNKAAHGQWDQFKEEDVKQMINGIRSFMTEYLS